MAYNLQPLIQILEEILHPHHHRRPNWILDPCKKPLIESLLVKACFLNEFFENPSSVTGHAVRSLEGRIRDAAYRAQNVIEYYLAKKLISNKYTKRITISPPDLLQQIADLEFELIFDKLVDIMDGRDMRSGPSPSDMASSSSEDLNPKNIVVGIKEDLIQLKEQLVMPLESKIQIIPIVGMGGIGKTTLAQTLYNDQCVVSCFDIRAWAAISQNYSEREILLALLKCGIGHLSDKMVHQDENDELGLQLYRKLWGRRYLIVLDDMWNCEAWDCIKRFFPDENNGSRIMVTTRQQNVANYIASSENLHHQMKLLNEVESWKLLCQKVFSQGNYALELEEVGKSIAKDCWGLPLAIHVVGGVLSALEKTQDAWIRVALDVSSSVNSGEISNILSLSYDHLPSYLKPCFLYMGAFPEGRHIQASKLIKLWMAEGFLKPISGMSFEETARVYLKELVERNLLSVGQQETRRKTKSYIMHDLLRDLCISKAQEEKFFYVGIDAIKNLNPDEMLRARLSFRGSDYPFTHLIESPCMPSAVCSILMFAKARELSWLDKYAFNLVLLKVLDVLEGNRVELPKAMETLVNLRYLAARISNSDPYPISNLCNLQTVIFDLYLGNDNLFSGKVKELVLNFPQLRHIKFKGHYYPYFGLEVEESGSGTNEVQTLNRHYNRKRDYYPFLSLEDGESVNGGNEELQTLSMVEIDYSFQRILKAMPNLKKLGIDCRSVSLSLCTIDLSSLSQLQTLKCSRWLSWQTINLTFPHSLIKMTLEYCHICSEFLNEIGRLPNLQVLKFQHCYLSEDSMGEWKPTQGEFQQLRFLQLENFRGLKEWTADEIHYPRLEHLLIYGCDELKEIPRGIGEIPTLEMIKVHSSNDSIEESAEKIQEDQVQCGNNALQVRITSKFKEVKATLWEASDDFQAGTEMMFKL